MDIYKEKEFMCPKCNQDSIFKIEMYYVKYNGIVPCWECQNCHIVVPNYAFNNFLATGRIIIGL